MTVTAVTDEAADERQQPEQPASRSDAELFWLTLAIFVALLIAIYLVTSPPGGGALELLLGR
ncbi:hypothetical protein [Bradyrhizobium sp. WD16]|uniref:hypothetical protein n=1 Tax=Bradyrhizobium sp. WD16 TaxID=1521768 RepID=UPI0020A416F5|nr:hypothetical protein [Bradyrhizobium sp. WD16]UTD25982.1 hypothetical protein DB459_02630 [Bradyrhizobium sp. WD16]